MTQGINASKAPKKLNIATLNALIFWVVIIVIVCTMTIIDRLFIVEMYNVPTIEKGRADYTGREYFGWILDGEWEFYYNQWIVTDNIEEPRLDGYVNPGDKWTGTVVNGEKIGREGYASYRFYVDNYGTGYDIYIKAHGKVATRVYINGVLSTTNATVMSKENGKSKVVQDDDLFYLEKYHITEEGPIEIVLETGYTDNAGIREIPYVTNTYKDTAFTDWVYYGFRDECCLAVIATMFIFGWCVAIADIKRTRSLSFGYFLFAIVLFYLFTIDGIALLRRMQLANAVVIEYMSFVTPAIVIVAAMYHWHRSRIIDTSNKEIVRYLVLFAILNVIQVLLYYLARGTDWRFVAIPIFFVSMLPIPYYLHRARHPDRYAYTVLISLLVILFLLQMFDVSGALKIAYGQVFAGGILLISLVIVVLFVLKAYRDDKLILEKTNLEKAINNMERQALLAQIKPHFIFNSLALIKASYHTDVAHGDRAIMLFYNHLKVHEDVVNVEKTTFLQEINFVNNYFELEKLRNASKIQLEYDITIDDFSLPLLTIQPLVENAVKYSRIQEKADGKIIVRTFFDDDYIYIEVIDNGVGFDPSTVKPNSAGINNVRERLKHYLDGELIIESKIGLGTKITVKIPRKNNVKTGEGL